jgi:hypothetical protein
LDWSFWGSFLLASEVKSWQVCWPIPALICYPIRALIRVGLAALSGPDPGLIPNPAVWRFWHGNG